MATDYFTQNQNPQPVTYSNGWQFDPNKNQYINTATGESMTQSSYNMYVQEERTRAQADAEAKKHAAEMLAQGLNPDGSPIRKDWQSLLDPTTGKLKDGYNLDISQLDPTQWSGYSKYKNEAMRTGPSAWAQMQNQEQDFAAQATKEAAARQAMSGMNQGIQALAMRGGVSAGARQLASRSSSRDLLNARQQTARAATGAKLNIASTDEGNRIGQLANLASSEQSIGQYNKTLEGKVKEYNINNLIQEQQGKRGYDDMTYQEQMKKWAADKQAQATANSGGGGGGCFITTAVCVGLGFPDDNDILNTLRKFRDSEMGGKSSEDLKQYYTMAPLIVPHIENKPEILLGLLKDYLVPAVALINKGKNIEAKELYKRMVLQLRQTYLDAGQANG